MVRNILRNRKSYNGPQKGHKGTRTTDEICATLKAERVGVSVSEWVLKSEFESIDSAPDELEKKIRKCR